MKYLLIVVFALGMSAGVWTTGESISINNLVSQECKDDNSSEIVFLGNLKVGNPLGGITCNKETLDKASQTIDKSGQLLNESLDKVNASLDSANNSLDNSGGIYSDGDFDFSK
jgi:hypothetical protein